MRANSNSGQATRGQYAVALLLTFVLGGCGAGTNENDPFVAGRSIYGDICSACHGNSGQGGVGPDLSAVTETFPDCRDQMKWITLGSDGWKASVGTSYGANAKPVKGGMQPMADQLTENEIAQVAAFERTQFGGSPREAAQKDCGIVPTDSND